MTNNEFGGRGFFGRTPFGRENIHEKWSCMTEEEKKSFVEERVNLINEMVSRADEHHRGMTVDGINKRCEKWMAMSDEEKESFVNERNQQMQHFAQQGMCGNDFFHGHAFHHRFGF